MYEAMFHPAVIEAVNMKFKSGRPFSYHWEMFMDADVRESFSNDVNYFESCCINRRAWLAGR